MAANINIADEEFVRLLFNPLIESGKVKDKNGSQLDLDKHRVSRLMRGKDDVPRAMRTEQRWKFIKRYFSTIAFENGFYFGNLHRNVFCKIP